VYTPSEVTVAVCIRCGAIKRGALTPCPECGFEPREKEEKAQSMALIDRFLSKEDLSAISERIKSGQPVSYPGELMQGFADALEDNLTDATLIRTVLERDGDIRVTLAQDGIRGCQLVESHRWDLVVTDFNLPGRDGIEVITASKTNQPNTPIISTSAYSAKV